MQLCLDCFTGSFGGELAVCGGVLDDGPVMGLCVLLEGPEMIGSCCSDGPGMDYLDVWMVLERVLHLCVWDRCGGLLWLYALPCASIM